MKINKNSLDKLILEVMKEAVVSANPLTDSPNPANVAKPTNPNPSSLMKPEETVDPSKMQVDKQVIKSLFSTKEAIRLNINKMPANELVKQVNTLISQLNFLDDLQSKV